MDYNNICKGRRIFKADLAVIPARQTGQKEIFEWNDDAEEYITHIINLCRKEVAIWRGANYPNTTRVKSKHGTIKKLMIEISGMSKDKAEKKWFVENRWIPAVIALKDKYGYAEWYFIEVANYISNIKNQVIEKIQSI